MERAEAIKNVVNAVDNFQTNEGNRDQDDNAFRQALTDLYQYSKDHNDTSVMKDGVQAAQAEAKKLGLPDVQISFSEGINGVDKVKRDWKAMGMFDGSTEVFSEVGASMQYAMKQMNIIYQMNRVTDANNKK